MLDDFLTRAVLAGLGLVLATGTLGSFVVWRRMAYFGDSTSHAAILGVALSFALSMPFYLGTASVAVAMALTVAWLTGRGQGMDTVLGVIAHSALAVACWRPVLSRPAGQPGVLPVRRYSCGDQARSGLDLGRLAGCAGRAALALATVGDGVGQ